MPKTGCMRIRSSVPIVRRILDRIKPSRPASNQSGNLTCEEAQHMHILEKELRATQTLISNLPGFLFRCQPDRYWTMTYLSNGFEDITGYAREEILQNKKRSYESIIHPDYRQHLRDAYEKQAAHDKHFEVEYPIMHKEGGIKWIWERSQLISNTSGQPLFLKGFVTDITSRKKTESDLKTLVSSAENFLQMAVEDIHYHDIANTFREITGARFAALNVYEMDGKHFSTVAISGMSKYLKMVSSMLGYNIIGKRWPADLVRDEKIRDRNLTRFANLKELTGAVLPGFVLNAIEQMVDLGETCVLKIMQGQKMIGDFTFVMPRDTSYIDDTIVNIYSRLTGLLLTRKQAEEALLEAKSMAETANQAKSQFLANMSHEIRTPLNAILGFSEILENQLEDEENRKMIASVNSAGRLLLSLINDILDLSKIEAGKMAITPKPSDIKELLRETRTMFSEKAEKKGLTLGLNISDGFPASLVMDETKVKQILVNLLSNAIKFTDDGRVDVRATFTPNEARDRGLLEIAVCDTGMGIPAEQQELIFDNFSQLGNKLNHTQEGTGLGLAIVKRLTEKMNGSIALSSTPGVGSCFTIKMPDIEVPKSQEKSTGTDQPVAAVESSFEGAVVMVVDDAIANLEVTAVMLESLNMQPVKAISGADALQKLANTRPDLILLDITMPDMSGNEVAKNIKANPEWATIPVIAYSASSQDTQTDQADWSFDGFLLKPVTKDKLLATLKKHLEATGLTTEELSAQLLSRESISIPEENIHQLPALLKTLENDFLPRWHTIKDQLVLFKIQAFAGELKAVAEDYEVHELSRYAHQLHTAVNSLDLDTIEQILPVFPEILNRIREVHQDSTT